jgi:aminoglycoside 6'-N-acetyltransferase I
MRSSLWPGTDEQDSIDWLAREDAVTIVASDATDSSLIGFAEAGERAYADGCDSSPVAFLEGWYVAPSHRHHHVGRSLIELVERWARQRGLAELASDTLLENDTANLAHRAVGFVEVERSIKFRKPL